MYLNQCKICGLACEKIHIEEKDNRVYTILQCMFCKTIQVAEFYESISPEYSNLKIEDFGDKHIWMNRLHKFVAYKYFNRLFSSILGPRFLSSKFIDIGCGTGGFIEHLQSVGISCSGFDASKVQVDYALKHGLPVVFASSVNEYLFKNELAARSFDVVTMWDVLEHIREPYDFLLSTHNLLKPNGLVYVSVPSSGGHAWKRPLFRLFGVTYSFDPWEHVFYYNQKSLGVLMMKCGFEVVESGVVPCYRRNGGVVEYARRFMFYFLNIFPSFHPQIYLIAKLRSS